MHTQSELEAARLTWRPKPLADALGVSVRQVYRLEQQGRLKSIKLGRVKLFTDASVRELIAAA
jgi:excisionase family DNA binding protein